MSHFALKLSDSESIQWFILNYLLIQKNTEYFLWILLWFREIQKSTRSSFWYPSESVVKLEISLKLFWISTDCHWTLGTGSLLSEQIEETMENFYLHKVNPFDRYIFEQKQEKWRTFLRTLHEPVENIIFESVKRQLLAKYLFQIDRLWITRGTSQWYRRISITF